MSNAPLPADGYNAVLTDVVELLEHARSAAARSINAVMTMTYWQIGRRIVRDEQSGRSRAAYGEARLRRLAADLTARFGRGFSRQNLQIMRQFYSPGHPRRFARQRLAFHLPTPTSPAPRPPGIRR